MKVTTIFLGAAAITTTIACPGQEKAMRDLKNKLASRQADTSSEDSNELIGDLLTTGAQSPVAQDIQNIITGNGDPESSETWSGTLWPKGSRQCQADTCCIWKWIALDMERKFRGISGRCNGYARGAVRLGFHDAGAWDKNVGFGGADGSIILAGEMSRPENKGLEEIVAVTKDWYNQHKTYGVSMADLIQMGANVAAVVCPLGPRVRSYVGRQDSTTPNKDGLLPDVNWDADKLISFFEDKTIRPHGLTALVGAHTTSQQRFFDPSRANDPQDSSPGVWDVRFYNETLSASVPKRVLKFPSDVKLAAHPRITTEWIEFMNGQSHWNQDYAREYIRLSLLGVNNINDLKECTKVLPKAIISYKNPDQAFINKWLAGGLAKIGAKIREGLSITAVLLSALGIKNKREFVA